MINYGEELPIKLVLVSVQVVRHRVLDTVNTEDFNLWQESLFEDLREPVALDPSLEDLPNLDGPFRFWISLGEHGGFHLGPESQL